MTMDREKEIARLGLDEEATAQVEALTADLNPEAISPELLATLALGITHDTDVKNANAEGYLRGRNEKIEAVLHPQPDPADESEKTPVFPSYCRRSVWD